MFFIRYPRPLNAGHALCESPECHLSTRRAPPHHVRTPSLSILLLCGICSGLCRISSKLFNLLAELRCLDIVFGCTQQRPRKLPFRRTFTPLNSNPIHLSPWPQKQRQNLSRYARSARGHLSISNVVQNNSFVLKIKPEVSVSFEDRPVPKLENPFDVLLQVNYTGICGSDIHYWQHGRIGHFVVEDPMVLGHESAGTVLECGSQVTTLKKGDRVAMEPGIPCRRCRRCKEGKYNICLDMAFAATPPYDGTLAKYYILPEDFCYKLPDHMSLEEGALMEPLAVAVHITKQSGVKTGDSIVVFGAGPVGLLCCAVAKAFGASKIVAVDIVDSRLEFAKQFAATGVYKSQKISAEENAQQIKDDHDLPLGADTAIDASGVEPSIQTAINVLRSGGTYVQGGMGKDNCTFPIMATCTRELNVKGSFRYGPGDYATAVGLCASGTIDVKKLITKKVSFDDAEQAFEDIKNGKGIKVLIEGPK